MDMENDTNLFSLNDANENKLNKFMTSGRFFLLLLFYTSNEFINFLCKLFTNNNFVCKMIENNPNDLVSHTYHKLNRILILYDGITEMGLTDTLTRYKLESQNK